MFGTIVSPPFSDQVRQLGIGGSPAIHDAYSYLLQCLVWDLGLACRYDPGIEVAWGEAFKPLIAAIAPAIGLDIVALGHTLEEAMRIHDEAGGGIDFRPVMDVQTFRFLQRLTEDRYTKQRWVDTDDMVLMRANGEVQFVRLMQAKALKDYLGLHSRVIGKAA